MTNAFNSENPEAIIKSWVELYSDQLFSWAYYKTSDKETAEDLVQETFLAAIQSYQKFKGTSEPKTWLFSILKNKIADHFRKVYRNNATDTISFHPFFDDHEHWTPDQTPQSWHVNDEQHLLDNNEFKSTLALCMEKIPSNWKSAIVLKFMEEKNSDVICQELGITTTNYWQILHRAKLQLRKCLEVNWFKK